MVVEPSYLGQAMADLPEGLGVMLLPSGVKYTGSFHNGKPHGCVQEALTTVGAESSPIYLFQHGERIRLAEANECEKEVHAAALMAEEHRQRREGGQGAVIGGTADMRLAKAPPLVSLATPVLHKVAPMSLLQTPVPGDAVAVAGAPPAGFSPLGRPGGAGGAMDTYGAVCLALIAGLSALVALVYLVVHKGAARRHLRREWEGLLTGLSDLLSWPDHGRFSLFGFRFGSGPGSAQAAAVGAQPEGTAGHAGGPAKGPAKQPRAAAARKTCTYRWLMRASEAPWAVVHGLAAAQRRLRARLAAFAVILAPATIVPTVLRRAFTRIYAMATVSGRRAGGPQRKFKGGQKKKAAASGGSGATGLPKGQSSKALGVDGPRGGRTRGRDAAGQGTADGRVGQATSTPRGPSSRAASPSPFRVNKAVATAGPSGGGSRAKEEGSGSPAPALTTSNVGPAAGSGSTSAPSLLESSAQHRIAPPELHVLQGGLPGSGAPSPRTRTTSPVLTTGRGREGTPNANAGASVFSGFRAEAPPFTGTPKTPLRQPAELPGHRSPRPTESSKPRSFGPSVPGSPIPRSNLASSGFGGSPGAASSDSESEEPNPSQGQTLAAGAADAFRKLGSGSTGGALDGGGSGGAEGDSGRAPTSPLPVSVSHGQHRAHRSPSLQSPTEAGVASSGGGGSSPSQTHYRGWHKKGSSGKRRDGGRGGGGEGRSTSGGRGRGSPRPDRSNRNRSRTSTPQPQPQTQQPVQPARGRLAQPQVQPTQGPVSQPPADLVEAPPLGQVTESTAQAQAQGQAQRSPSKTEAKGGWTTVGNGNGDRDSTSERRDSASAVSLDSAAAAVAAAAKASANLPGCGAGPGSSGSGAHSQARGPQLEAHASHQAPPHPQRQGSIGKPPAAGLVRGKSGLGSGPHVPPSSSLQPGRPLRTAASATSEGLSRAWSIGSGRSGSASGTASSGLNRSSSLSTGPAGSGSVEKGSGSAGKGPEIGPRSPAGREGVLSGVEEAVETQTQEQDASAPASAPIVSKLEPRRAASGGFSPTIVSAWQGALPASVRGYSGGGNDTPRAPGSPAAGTTAAAVSNSGPRSDSDPGLVGNGAGSGSGAPEITTRVARLSAGSTEGDGGGGLSTRSSLRRLSATARPFLPSGGASAINSPLQGQAAAGAQALDAALREHFGSAAGPAADEPGATAGAVGEGQGNQRTAAQREDPGHENWAWGVVQWGPRGQPGPGRDTGTGSGEEAGAGAPAPTANARTTMLPPPGGYWVPPPPAGPGGVPMGPNGIFAQLPPWAIPPAPGAPPVWSPNARAFPVRQCNLPHGFWAAASAAYGHRGPEGVQGGTTVRARRALVDNGAPPSATGGTTGTEGPASEAGGLEVVQPQGEEGAGPSSQALPRASSGSGSGQPAVESQAGPSAAAVSDSAAQQEDEEGRDVMSYADFSMAPGAPQMFAWPGPPGLVQWCVWTPEGPVPVAMGPIHLGPPPIGEFMGLQGSPPGALPFPSGPPPGSPGFSGYDATYGAPGGSPPEAAPLELPPRSLESTPGTVDTYSSYPATGAGSPGPPPLDPLHDSAQSTNTRSGTPGSATASPPVGARRGLSPLEAEEAQDHVTPPQGGLKLQAGGSGSAERDGTAAEDQDDRAPSQSVALEVSGSAAPSDTGTGGLSDRPRPTGSESTESYLVALALVEEAAGAAEDEASPSRVVASLLPKLEQAAVAELAPVPEEPAVHVSAGADSTAALLVEAEGHGSGPEGAETSDLPADLAGTAEPAPVPASAPASPSLSSQDSERLGPEHGADLAGETKLPPSSSPPLQAFGSVPVSPLRPEVELSVMSSGAGDDAGGGEEGMGWEWPKERARAPGPGADATCSLEPAVGQESVPIPPMESMGPQMVANELAPSQSKPEHAQQAADSAEGGEPRAEPDGGSGGSGLDRSPSLQAADPEKVTASLALPPRISSVLQESAFYSDSEGDTSVYSPGILEEGSGSHGLAASASIVAAVGSPGQPGRAARSLVSAGQRRASGEYRAGGDATAGAARRRSLSTGSQGDDEGPQDAGHEGEGGESDLGPVQGQAVGADGSPSRGCQVEPGSSLGLRTPTSGEGRRSEGDGPSSPTIHLNFNEVGAARLRVETARSKYQSSPEGSFERFVALCHLEKAEEKLAETCRHAVQQGHGGGAHSWPTSPEQHPAPEPEAQAQGEPGFGPPAVVSPEREASLQLEGEGKAAAVDAQASPAGAKEPGQTREDVEAEPPQSPQSVQ